jgi:hypothetical protein
VITDHELIALAVAQAATGICSDRQFLGMIGRRLPGRFGTLARPDAVQPPAQGLAPWIATVQLQVA